LNPATSVILPVPLSGVVSKASVNHASPRTILGRQVVSRLAVCSLHPSNLPSFGELN
jgi:hypothetical protein